MISQNLPTPKNPGFNLGLFKISNDISRVMFEVTSNLKLLKNELVLHHLVRQFLEQNKQQIEEEGIYLNKSFKLVLKIDALIDELAEGQKKELYFSRREKLAQNHNAKFEKYRTNRVVQYLLFKKYERHKIEILEYLREEVDDFKFEFEKVNLFRLFIGEFLYLIKTKQVNPVLEKILDVVINRVVSSIKDPSVYRDFNFYNKKERDSKFPVLMEAFQNDVHPLVQLNESKDSPQYDFIFAVALRQTPVQKLNEFLEFQYQQFEDDFFEFIEICLIEHHNLLQKKQVTVIGRWILKRKGQKKNVLEIKLPKLKERKKEDSFTDLSMTQTAYLFHLLKKVKIIINDRDIQTDTEISKAIRIMTGYSENTIRQSLSKPNTKIDDEDLKVIQKKLKIINSLISRELTN